MNLENVRKKGRFKKLLGLKFTRNHLGHNINATVIVPSRNGDPLGPCYVRAIMKGFPHSIQMSEAPDLTKEWPLREVSCLLTIIYHYYPLNYLDKRTEKAEKQFMNGRKKVSFFLSHYKLVFNMNNLILAKSDHQHHFVCCFVCCLFYCTYCKEYSTCNMFRIIPIITHSRNVCMADLNEMDLMVTSNYKAQSGSIRRPVFTCHP